MTGNVMANDIQLNLDQAVQLGPDASSAWLVDYYTNYNNLTAAHRLEANQRLQLVVRSTAGKAALTGTELAVN